MKASLTFLCAFVLSLIQFGCSSLIPVSKPTTGSQLQLKLNRNEYTIVGHAKGLGCESYVLFIPITSEFAYELALKEALTASKADVLVQTTQDTKYFMVPPFYTERCLLLSGVAIRFKKTRRNRQGHLRRYGRIEREVEPEPQYETSEAPEVRADTSESEMSKYDDLREISKRKKKKKR